MNWKFWEKKDDITKTSGRKWLFAILGAVLLVAGWFVAGLYTENRDNLLLGIMTIVLWGGGIYLIWAGFKPREEKVRYKKADKKLESQANTVNICVRKRGMDDEYRPFKIEFTHVEVEENETPPGTLVEVTNLHKYYYFNSVYYEKDGETVIKQEDWELPDGEYLSPRKYVIPLTMQAYAKYIRYKRSKSLFQKISAGIMLGAFAITTFFFWLTIGG